MNYHEWISEIEEIVVDEYDEDTWDIWSANDEAWQELFEEGFNPEDAVEEYKQENV